MRLFYQILFLFLLWFTTIVNPAPAFSKVSLPSFEVSFSKTENYSQKSVSKISFKNFARSCTDPTYKWFYYQFFRNF